MRLCESSTATSGGSRLTLVSTANRQALRLSRGEKVVPWTIGFALTGATSAHATGLETEREDAT